MAAEEQRPWVRGHLAGNGPKARDCSCRPEALVLQKTVSVIPDLSCYGVVNPAMQDSRAADSADLDLVAVSGARVDAAGCSVAAHIEALGILEK